MTMEKRSLSKKKGLQLLKKQVSMELIQIKTDNLKK